MGTTKKTALAGLAVIRRLPALKMETTMTDLVEKVAKAIAYGDGGRMTYKPPGGMMQTVASQAGFGHFSDAAEKYAAEHWEKYRTHAEFAIAAGAAPPPKVYVVHEIDYTVSEILGVFASHEDAEALATQMRDEELARRQALDSPPTTASWEVEPHEVKR